MLKPLKNFIINHRAQITLTGIMGFFVLIVLLLALLPTLSGMITNATTGANATITGEMEGVILRLVPVLMIIAVVMSLFIYVQPRYG